MQRYLDDNISGILISQKGKIFASFTKRNTLFDFATFAVT